jgi:hypothetical protein
MEKDGKHTELEDKKVIIIKEMHINIKITATESLIY